MAKNNKTNIGITKNGELKPEWKEATSTCNARLKNATGYCGKPAGEGTDHEGTGRCKDHGGAKGTGRPKQNFQASEFAPNEVLQRFEQISELDPTSILNIDNEITSLRSIFYRYLKTCEEKQKMPHPDDLKKYTDCLAKMVDIKQKAEAKAAATKYLTPNVFILYVNNITNILRKHIQDPSLLNRIADELEGLDIPQVSDESSN